jgi:hypothetical protein
MSRWLIVAMCLASVFVIASGAEAKGPPTGIQLCGQNACATITQTDSEPLAIKLFYGDGTVELSTPMVPPAAFYALHWRFDGDTHTGYYVPLLNVFRYVGDPASSTESASSLVHWVKLDAGARALLARAIGTLEPFARPVPTRVTVGGRDAADPESYLRLWSIGKATYRWPDRPFLRIAIVTATPSPWTDRTAHLSIARRGAFLMRDGTIMRIRPSLARQIRARVSLR